VAVSIAYIFVPVSRLAVDVEPAHANSRGRNGLSAQGQEHAHRRTVSGVFSQFLRPQSSINTESDASNQQQWDSDHAPLYTTANQKMLVADAKKRVRHAASNDPTVNKVAKTKSDIEASEREHALLAMMGIRHGQEETDAAPLDKTSIRARRSLDRVEALRGCETLECLRIAHDKPAGKATKNFPHFMIVGFQKSATTSLHYHLVRHPEIIRPWEKEPEFFSNTCGYDIASCPPEDVKDYIQRMLRVHRYAAYDGTMAAYEASTHYSRAGMSLAPQLIKEMPWLKVILLLREPISRASSMLVHIYDKNQMIKGMGAGGCLKKYNMDLGHCLMSSSQITQKANVRTNGGLFTNDYATPLKTWLETFPRDQIFVGQYEVLVNEATQQAELEKIKKFLDIDPSLPTGEDAELMSRNSRKDSVNPDGWQMQRTTYQEIVDMVSEDSRVVSELIEQYGFGKASDWLGRWSAVWERNLRDNCDDRGTCMIQLS